MVKAAETGPVKIDENSSFVLYSAVDQKKLDWDIVIGEDGKSSVSDGVYSQWPQIRMAVQMLGRLPPTSGQRKVFEGQIQKVKDALYKTKEEFSSIFTGPVSAAFTKVYRPQGDKEGEIEYFDRVNEKRDYVLLGVDCHTDESQDVHLPPIQYVFGATEVEGN